MVELLPTTLPTEAYGELVVGEYETDEQLKTAVSEKIKEIKSETGSGDPESLGELDDDTKSDEFDEKAANERLDNIVFDGIHF